MQTHFSTEVPIAPSILYSSPNDPIFKDKFLPAMFTAVAKKLTDKVDAKTFTCGIIVMEYFENAPTLNDLFARQMRIPYGDVISPTYINNILTYRSNKKDKKIYHRC